MARDLLERGDPDTTLGEHRLDHLLGAVPAREAPRHHRVPDGDPQPAIFKGRLEFRPKDLPGPFRRADGLLVAEVEAVGELRPVVQAPMRGKLDELACFAAQQIGNIVSHQRGVVEEAFLEQELGRVVREIVEWEHASRAAFGPCARR